MQTKTRKLLSTLLALAMVLGLFAAMPMTARAASVNWDGTNLTVADSDVITIDTATWSGNGTLTVPAGATVTVQGTVTGKPNTTTLDIGAGAKVIWEAAYTDATGSAIFTITGTGTLEVTTGSITTTTDNADCISTLTAKIIASGGTVSATTGTAIYSTGSVEVTGGTITAGSGNAVQANTCTISGTNTAISSTSGNAIVATGVGANVIINNGTVSSVSGGAINCAGNVTVNGGTVRTSISGAIHTSALGIITIDGGTVEATGGNSTAISNAVNGSTINIKSGTVRATGSNGVAIHATGSSDTVTLSGGTISATTGTAIKAASVEVVSGSQVTISNNAGATSPALELTTGLYANSGAKVTVNGKISVTGVNGGIKSTDQNSFVEIIGDVSFAGNDAGIGAYDDSIMTIIGSVSATGTDFYVYSYDAALSITGNVSLTGADSYIEAESGTLNITGAVTLTGNNSNVYAEGGTLNINGDVTATQDVWAWDNGVLNITGNVTAHIAGAGNTNGGTLTINGNLDLAVGSCINTLDGGKTYITGTVTPVNADIFVDTAPLTAGTPTRANVTLPAPYNGYYWDEYTNATVVAPAPQSYVYIRKGAIPATPPSGGNTNTSNPPPPIIIGSNININPIISSITATPKASGATLSINAASYGYGQTYQWQVQQPNGTWADIPGATASTFEYTGLTPGQSYNVRCMVRNGSGGSVFSREVTFTAEKATMVVIDPAQPAAAFPTTGIINANNVNVRPEPGTKKKAIGRFNKGGKATLLGYENGYFKIEWSNAAGFAYVSGDYIDASFAKPLEGAAKSNLTVYTQKSTSSKYKAATAKKGAPLLLLAREGKWWKAQVGGMEGYIPASKVTVR